MAERFHINCDLQPGPVELEGPEAHHLAVVLRLHPGDRVCLFNGDGREYPAVVEDVAKRHLQLRVVGVESPMRERPARLEVACAIPKGDRAQFLLEKLTEIGVTHFIPLQTVYSVVNPREERIDKLLRHIIEASKQCGRNVLMVIEPLVEWSEYLRRTNLPVRKLIAHPGGPRLQPGTPTDEVAVAVGPEGGFRDDEVEMGRAAGWEIVSLGPRLLRVETAALALASWYSLGQR
jgi:16S rRNA (uracil1498-N3)-methyltransferase